MGNEQNDKVQSAIRRCDEAVRYARIVVREADACRFDAPKTELLARALIEATDALKVQETPPSATGESFDYRWRDVDVTAPPDGDEVILFHCLGDSRRGTHAYDIASYINGNWIFPWDRGDLNPTPRWPIAWMPIKRHESDDEHRYVLHSEKS